MEIPILSISQIGLLNEAQPSLEAFKLCGGNLKRAFSSVGFIYIKDHGIDEKLIEKSMEASKNYFQLPQDVKESFPRDPLVQQGYVAPGREIFDQKEDGSKAVHEVREAFEVTRISGPDAKFPDNEAPELRPCLTKLAQETKTLAFRILKSLALGLGLDQDFFVLCHQEILGPKSISKLRSIYYPALSKIDLVSGHVRCGEHSDYGTITFLYQDAMAGLEVRAIDNSWIKATPIPGSILINVGDLLEIYSNGLFPATLHRVVIPEEEVLQKKARQSIVFFLHPESSALVQPLISKGAQSKAQTYHPITALDHVNKRFAATYQY